ncbi:hypothetical protein M1432_01670 [Patescibacteria group bacterium]|nr:hypothetical protein [Patescibacteria group bacterium]
MANNQGINKSLLIAIAVVILIVGGVIGYFIGQMNGRQAASNEYLPIVNMAFPAPSGTLNDLQGTVENVYGATISLTVQKPSDYLPHPDGSPRATETVNANTGPNTQFVSISLDKNGNPVRTPITLADIKSGDTVMVKSAQNIFSATTFDVTEVDLIK